MQGGRGGEHVISVFFVVFLFIFLLFLLAFQLVMAGNFIDSADEKLPCGPNSGSVTNIFSRGHSSLVGA